MDGTHIFLFLSLVFIWLALLLLGAVPITKPSRSQYELLRLQKSGDATAQYDIERLGSYGTIRSLRRLLSNICLVLIAILGLFGFGWMWGVIILLLILLANDRISQLSLLRSVANTLYASREKRIVAWVLRSRWLTWFVSEASEEETIRISSKSELSHLLSDDHSFLTTDEYTRLKAGLSFDEKRVGDVMTPVSMVDTARSEDVLGPLVLDELHKTGHSRFPVIEDDINHVVGVLYIHRLLNTNDTKKTVESAMERDVHYIHEGQSLSHALHGFLRTHRHLFIVVNDYRETVGVISLEDALEVLIGKKIVDEFDRFDDLRLVAESNPHKNNEPRGKKDI